jgi:hypothetical protein
MSQSWIDIPSLSSSFLTTLSPINIVRGEEKEVGLQLVSTFGSLPTSITFLTEVDSSEIEIQEFSPESDDMSSSITQPDSFRLWAPEGVIVGFHSGQC